jgi:serine/threonine protein kinase
VEASRLINRLLALQEIIITRDGLGQVLQFGGDSIFAVFDNASVALNRALEIQRLLDTCVEPAGNGDHVGVRIGLHMGEVLMKEGERVDIISRHVNRAHRVMEAAVPGQILASNVVVDSARDFLDLPREHQAIRDYGEFFLKGVGPTILCEVADLRFRNPEPPRIAGEQKPETALRSRFEQAGYRLLKRLGESAAGVMYEGQRISDGKNVALKVISPGLTEDDATRTEFLQGLRRISELRLNGVVGIVEERLGQPPAFLATDLFEGEPADVGLRGAGMEKIARVFRALCDILAPIHAAGAVHGNVKAGNVLVNRDSSVALRDHGIAGLLARPGRTGVGVEIPGGPAGLAPEVIQGGEPSRQSDIYSVGVLMFKVLAGREPFVGETLNEILNGHLHEDPPPVAALNPAVAEGLQRVCLKALEKKPEDRYESVGEMAEDLGRFLRGEVIRTRPSLYDNFLFHRVQKHVDEITEWSERGLLNEEESHRLLSSYEGLQRRGLPAIMEGRLFRLWQTLVYVGGWAVINGALLWLVQYWPQLSRAGKLALGSVPALTTFALAATMWKIERFRLFFVALIVAILATPLLTGVWLHEFQIAGSVPESALSFEVFHNGAASQAITNRQMFWTALITLLVATGAAAFTRTTTHSAQMLAALAATYTTFLFIGGLWLAINERQEWARAGLELTPLLLLTAATGIILLRLHGRYYQAPPWVYFSAALLLGISYAVALHGPEEWQGITREHRLPISWLLVSLFGAAQVSIGLIGRKALQHHCRLATRALIFFGLVNVLAGLGVAGWIGTWPEGWPAILVRSKSMSWPHIVLPVAALVITLMACRYNMFVFLLVGLAGIAFSVHVLGHLYFEEIPAWPKMLMIAGAVCFFVALFRELRRTRGNILDDVVSQTRL